MAAAVVENLGLKKIPYSHENSGALRDFYLHSLPFLLPAASDVKVGASLCSPPGVNISVWSVCTCAVCTYSEQPEMENL